MPSRFSQGDQEISNSTGQNIGIAAIHSANERGVLDRRFNVRLYGVGEIKNLDRPQYIKLIALLNAHQGRIIR